MCASLLVGPWINNCVGYRNHVHFFLFCIYMALIAGFSTGVAQRQFQRVIFHDQILFGLFAPLLQPYNMTITVIEHKTIGPITGVLTHFLFIINLVAMGLVLSLAIWQTSLISKGQTCVEEKINKPIATNVKQKRPYDYGTRENWKRFFEVATLPELLARLLVPYQFKPKYDGTQWTPKDNK